MGYFYCKMIGIILHTVYPLVYHCLSIRKPRPMSYDCILHINANVKEDKSSNQNSAIISGPHSSVRN